MLLIGVLNLYSAFSAVLQRKVQPQNAIELCCNAATGVIVILSLGFFSCRIPEYMSEIKESIGFLIDTNKAKNLIGVGEVSDLGRIEKKDVVYLTACGGLHFKRGFILSIAGSLLTYGLLISNLNISV
ncbi:hypothetical protein AVEN_136267-1 [Araneus ventricosus]|uniref:Uncharacterized protein n=1 Tax=Araneus ventricosus TaxID=182803 RepID=A0A4Y2SY28_ARAVE|nr:hypothetical protein AVEN_21253-1 [Araneus ventricosus]GBN93254.1 hypothetical protein AVEN_136267-1 [Araneus ventricosus]